MKHILKKIRNGIFNTIKEGESTSILTALKKSIYNPDTAEQRRLSGLYAYMSASLHTFLPDLPQEKHMEKIKEVIFNSKRIEFERMDKNILDNINTEEFKPVENSNFIVCSYHYGAYRNVASTLVKLNHKIFLVVNDVISETDQKIMQQQVQDLKGVYNHSLEGLPFLSVQDPTFIFKAKDLIDQGYIMLIFVDGNSGVDGVLKKTKKSVDIEFLGKKIGVRSGLPELAHAFNVPILPTFAFRQEIGVKLQSFDPIYPDKSISRKEFGRQSIKELYGILENQVKKEPFEWEGWLYLHKWIDIENLKATQKKEQFKIVEDKLKFNKKRYTIFTAKNKNTAKEDIFLLDRNTHLCYKIDEKTRLALKKNIGRVFAENEQLRKDMIEKQVLIS